MAPKRYFVPEDIWLLCSVSDPRLAPDGRRVAYVVGTPDADTDEQATTIWTAPSDGAAPPRQFTTGPADSTPRWSPDGTRLAFVANRGHGPQLFVAPLDGGEPHPVTDAPFGVATPAWSPDGRRLAYVARTGQWKKPEDRNAIERSAPRVVTGMRNRFDSAGWFDDRRSHIFVVAAAGGPARQVTDGDWDDADPAWSPDGSRLAFVSDRSATRADVEHRDVWVISVDRRSRPRRLTRGLGTMSGPRWSPDGTAVAFVGHEAPPGDTAANTQLLVVGVDDPEPPRPLSGRLDRPVAGLVRPVGGTHGWSPDGRAVLFLAGDAGAQRLYRAELDRADCQVLIGGERQILTFDTTLETIALVAVWPSAPPEVTCARIDGTEERRVSDANAALRAAARFAVTRRVAHRLDSHSVDSRSVDSRSVDSFVIYPPGIVKGTPSPTVLEIHGGPHGVHPQAAMMPLYQSLAAAGYVVVLANPRGSQGYGEEFARACQGDWGGGDFDDLMAVVDGLVSDGVADPQRLYVAGYSYGGFMTAWAVGHTDRFRAACISAPVIDLASMWGTTDIPYFAEAELGATPWDAAEAYRDHSPLTYLTNITTPVLLLHWEGDLRCPIGQADELFQGLKRLDREVEFVRYPGGFHVTRTPSQLIDYVGRHLDWFDRH